MSFFSKIESAFKAFDNYNSSDPNIETVDGKEYPKELLYAMRMSARLEVYEPNASEALRLAARCQHIGRWEIARKSFPMDRKGYLQWRSKLAIHHADIAAEILQRIGYDAATIDKVKFLVQKKQLHQHHPETQVLEDVVCLVFIEHYLDDFAHKHDDEKVIDILKKTLKKMSPPAIQEAKTIIVSERMSKLISGALA